MVELKQIISGPSKLSHGITSTQTHVYYCSDSLLLGFLPGEFYVSQCYSAHKSKLTSVSSYKNQLLVADISGFCTIVDANTMDTLHSFNVEDEVISCVINEYDGKPFYAVATISAKLFISINGETIIKETARPIESLAYLNNYFAVASTDKKVYVYDVSKSLDTPIYTVRRHEDFVSNMTMAEIHGCTILVCASHDRSVSIFNVSESTRITSILECHHPEKAAGCCFFEDTLITVGYDNRICWSTPNPRLRFTLDHAVFVEESRHHVGLLTVTATNSHIVALSSLGYLVCYDANTRKPVPCPGGHVSEITSIDLLDNKLIASASKDQSVRLWPAKNDKFFEISRVLSHGSELYCVKACPETTQLITGGDESTCRFLQPAQHTVDSLRKLGYKAPTVGKLPRGVGMLLLHQETEGFFDELPSDRFIDNSKRSRLAEDALLPFEFIEASDEPHLNQELARNTLWATLAAERVLVDLTKIIKINEYVIGTGYAARADESVLNIYKTFDEVLVGVKIVKGLFSSQVCDLKSYNGNVLALDRRHLIMTDTLGNLISKIKTPGIAHTVEVIGDKIYIMVEDTIYELRDDKFEQIVAYEELITASCPVDSELIIALGSKFLYKGQFYNIPSNNKITNIKVDDYNIYLSAGRFIYVFSK